MKLFIANTSTHVQEFLYRIPEFGRKVFQQFIPVGAQVMIYKDDSKELLEGILAQHTDTPMPFCVHADEAAKVKNFAGLVFSFDKPVPGSVIDERFEINQEALELFAAEQRALSAVAADANMSETAERIGGSFRNVEQTVIEENKKSEDPNAKKLNETVSVDRQGGKSKGNGRKK